MTFLSGPEGTCMAEMAKLKQNNFALRESSVYVCGG